MGATVAAYIRPEDVKFLYPDRPLMGAVQRDLATGVVLGQQASASFHRWRVLLSNELRDRGAGARPRLCIAPFAGWPKALVSLRKDAVIVLRPGLGAAL